MRFCVCIIGYVRGGSVHVCRPAGASDFRDSHSRELVMRAGRRIHQGSTGPAALLLGCEALRRPASANTCADKIMCLRTCHARPWPAAQRVHGAARDAEVQQMQQPVQPEALHAGTGRVQCSAPDAPRHLSPLAPSHPPSSHPPTRVVGADGGLPAGGGEGSAAPRATAAAGGGGR